PVGEGEPVEVTLRIGLADGEDGYNLFTPSTKAEPSEGEAAFGLDLVPSAQTKAGTTNVQPDALYNLEIRQYNSDGVHKGGSGTVADRTELGAPVTATFQTLDHCQLVLVAWGKDNTKRLGTGNLSAAQDVTLDASIIKDLKPEEQTDMNKMPYVLHLRDVNVTSDGRIYSAEGEALDVRLRLKRLAARLTVNWTYNVTISSATYSLKQILLHSIPIDYKVVAAPDKTDKTYPSLLDQFTTIQVPADQITSGSYSCWIPANVRGSNPNATSQAYRIKSNAPTGSSYIRFISVMNGEGNENKKLDYRLYLGGKETTDFNLYGNTDYSYMATFTHTQLPVNDLRVTIVDPVSASVDNRNFVPTANCFMVAPGGAFCFDPFAYQQNGQTITNGTLKGWSDSEGGIAYVKLLWQTKEDGDVGDPVMGTANSPDDHTNIVDIKMNGGGDVSKSATVKDINQARIYCRVAPNTTGGSGLIAAYNAADQIIWSWHVWVTDYSPSNIGSETVLEPVNKRKFRLYKNNGGTVSQCMMMDRNLGAYTGYVEVPGSILDMSKANGFHFQKGRKDPFPGSYTSRSLPTVYQFTLSNDYPPKHMLNRYEADGITWIIPVSLSKTSLRNAYMNPLSIANNSNTQWCTDNPLPQWDAAKTFNDPCPAGWRIPGSSDVQIFVDYNKSNLIPDFFTDAEVHGGLLLKYDETDNRTYLRFTGYPPNQTQLNNVGTAGYLTTWARKTVLEAKTTTFAIGGLLDYDAHTTRCIQEVP
ncbi:DUF4906 domain-containing protein, partial [uncultured Parabacteroides sp.]|uniref:DUF4906 domain-containing protein n=1 Tax=uncultured Parabacteroides sp. TaxID=512312 RepID=UPI0025DE981A